MREIYHPSYFFPPSITGPTCSTPARGAATSKPSATACQRPTATETTHHTRGRARAANVAPERHAGPPLVSVGVKPRPLYALRPPGRDLVEHLGWRSSSGSRTRRRCSARARFTLAGRAAARRSSRGAPCARTGCSPRCSRSRRSRSPYGLVYWGEQHIPSGLAAVLFGVLPLYTAVLAGIFLPEEPLARAADPGRPRSRSAAWRSPSQRASTLGDDELALAGAAALALSPLGASIGSIAPKLRAGGARPGGAQRLGDARRRPRCCSRSAVGESWGEFAWTGESIGSIAYLAMLGSAVTFVG